MNYESTIQNKTLRIIYKVIVSIQRLVAYFTCVAIPLIVVYQVILRYVLHKPLMGIEELLVFFIIWLYMIGGSVASEQRNHIECGILTLYIKRDFSMRVFKTFKSLFGVVIGFWLCYWAYWYFSYSLKLWKLSDILRIPMFIAESAVFIGFALMQLFTIIELIDHVKDVFSYRKEAKEK